MRCPTDDLLLAHRTDEASLDPELSSHIAGCADCGARLARIDRDLGHVRSATDELAGRTPASLEARLRWQLRAGATTLRQRDGLGARARAWLAGHWAAAVAGAAAVATVAVLLVAGPAPTVSASQLLQRSQASLFETLAVGDGRRIVYRVHYQGPSFGALPVDAQDYRIEEIWDRDLGVKLTLRTLDGRLVRGVAQAGGSRRIVALAPWGNLDMEFDLETSPDLAGLEERRLQIARSLFRMLLRAADPERLTHTEDDATHVLELGPPAPSAVGLGLIEIETARLVIDRDSYRLGDASIGGRLFGESFRLDARVESVESLVSGELTAADFTLPVVDDAIVIRGAGSDHPVADIFQALMQAVARSHASPGAP